MDHIKLSEVTPRRVIEAATRRIIDIPHSIAWNAKGGLAADNRRRLEQYHNKHVGERCFVIGNGPSLKKTDLSLLENEESFGANRLYLLFDEVDFRPTYYCSVNALVQEQFGDDMGKLDMDKFFNWDCRKHFTPSDDLMFIKGKLSLKDIAFQPDVTCQIGSGGTVTIASLHLAYYMGFKQVILIGCDHSFVEKGTPNKTISNDKDDVNHFHPDYFPKGASWQLPDFVKNEVAYRKVKEAFEADGREVIDATIDGKLQVFRKMDYNSLF